MFWFGRSLKWEEVQRIERRQEMAGDRRGVSEMGREVSVVGR